MAERVGKRITRFLERKKYITEQKAEDQSHERAEPDAITACAQLSLFPGAFVGRPHAVAARDEHEDFEPKRSKYAASWSGFNIHCGVHVAKDNDVGREKLIRYCARPPLSLERIEILRDGNIAYRVKYPRNGKTHRVMTPVEFLARVAGILPPPRYPLTRYYGIFAANHPLRKKIVLKVPGAKKKACDASSEPACTKEPRRAANPRADARNDALSPELGEVSPFSITVKHWGRLQDGALLATSPQVDWKTLMKRTFGFDGLDCKRCGGRLRVVSVIEDKIVAKKILDHLGLPSEPPRFARARDPSDQPAQNDDHAA
jgi:hypothetical protein